MPEIQYGQFRSEKESVDYSDNFHFHVLLGREGFHLSAGFRYYSWGRYNFSDVTLHYHKNEDDGGECKYSPTGHCSMYDSIRWMSINNIDVKMAVNYLIERIEKALNKEDSGLTWEEKENIRAALNNFEILEDEDIKND